MPLLALHVFVYEGDNRADATVAASALCHVLGVLKGRERPPVTFGGQASSLLWDDSDTAESAGVSAAPWAQPVVDFVQPGGVACLPMGTAA